MSHYYWVCYCWVKNNVVSYIGLIMWWIEIRYSIDNGYKGVAYKGYYAPFKLRYGWEETKIRNKAS